jgi:hypothetical protein
VNYQRRQVGVEQREEELSTSSTAEIRFNQNGTGRYGTTVSY